MKFSDFSSRSLRAAAIAALLSLPLAAAHAAQFASDRITVRTEGSGADVVLIHGMRSSPRVWTEMIKAVPGYRYHLVQMAGYGGLPNTGNKEGDVAAPVAEEIARYIKTAGLQKPAIIGHSMGGTIGMMIAARHPDALSRLMVVDMMPFLGTMFGPPGSTSASLVPTADAVAARMRAATPEESAKHAETTIAGMINTESMRAGALEDSRRSDTDMAIRSFRELILTDLRPELANIKVPVSVLYVYPKGAPIPEDKIDDYYQHAYSNAKHATVKRITDSGHFIMWDQPERFQAEVRDFLKAD